MQTEYSNKHDASGVGVSQKCNLKTVQDSCDCSLCGVIIKRILPNDLAEKSTNTELG